MFTRIARRYDLMNRIMTLGRDRAWRRHTVSQLGPALSSSGSTTTSGSPLVLDVATGTGDLAFEILRQHPGARAVGLDLVPAMLAYARHKQSSVSPDLRADPRILSFLAGDALRLPFSDGLFDGVVTGFALRNVTDIPAAFVEMARVTRPGGRVACLEIAKPSTPLFRQLFALYFFRIVPLIGGWISGYRAAYTYLPHSLEVFLTPDQIVEVMTKTGWRQVSYRRLMFGTVAVHVGTRA
jgi:demethylmenaquinone methyltransferase/2-methoxy-6-polyprenyl-1,4-benzoquinol methylase